ncbi:hypothetical protein [Sanyastnella coralliicola]|uniref:hypothetical protein n=1 Tax=Sanyastnella coralliicola TaxID=3069118 RepID=UPI0027B92E73|nr:hypothetical protein [Longitalea sp. SCSIO 12813]
MKTTFQKTLPILSIVVLLFVSCRTNDSFNDKTFNELTHKFNIDSSQVVYMFYQKYGFTDVCEDLIMLTNVDLNPELSERLPMSDHDLEMVAMFSISQTSAKPIQAMLSPDQGSEFKDIELEYLDYNPSSLKSIDFVDGSYEITQTQMMFTLKIYDEESGLLYVASHGCDGT